MENNSISMPLKEKGVTRHGLIAAFCKMKNCKNGRKLSFIEQ